MKKYFIIIAAVLLIILIVGLVIWWNPVAWFDKWLIKDTDNQQGGLPPYDGEVTTVHGVEMHDECLKKFQDFVKDYGADYSKCLVDFDFKEEYCGGLDPDTQAFSDVNVVVILDSSGSMAGEIGAQKKIDIAKKAVSDFLTKMPKGVNTGLVVYGQKGSNSNADKDLSCRGVEEVVGLGRNNSENIISATRSFEPRGWTPIAGSLSFAKDIFNEKGKGDKNYLILVSDGVESCDGDPSAAAANLKLEIKGINLIVIGFAIGGDAKKILQDIAASGGGSYLDANNSFEIAKAFNDQLLVVKKDCIKMTFLKMSWRYKNNNLNNLNCWLATQKKESDDFTTNVLEKFIDPRCNLEIADALRARHTEFWFKIKEIEKNGSEIYKDVELDYNNQLKAVGGL